MTDEVRDGLHGGDENENEARPARELPDTAGLRGYLREEDNAGRLLERRDTRIEARKNVQQQE